MYKVWLLNEIGVYPVNYLVTQVIPHSSHWFPIDTRTSCYKNLRHRQGGIRNTKIFVQ